MIVNRHQRRRRAAITKFAVLATLAVLVLTPRLDGVSNDTTTAPIETVADAVPAAIAPVSG